MTPNIGIQACCMQYIASSPDHVGSYPYRVLIEPPQSRRSSGRQRRGGSAQWTPRLNGQMNSAKELNVIRTMITKEMGCRQHGTTCFTRLKTYAELCCRGAHIEVAPSHHRAVRLRLTNNNNLFKAE